MARNWPTYAGCTIFVQMLMACSGEPAQNNTAISAAPEQSNIAPAGDRKLILAFGDSLYAGYGVAQNESFPYELEQALRTRGDARSEEHTPELQSLMRTSYAVFCFQKKTR